VGGAWDSPLRSAVKVVVSATAADVTSGSAIIAMAIKRLIMMKI
jgi:hypothetical protein